MRRVNFLFLLLFIPASAHAETKVFFSPHGGCEDHAVSVIEGAHKTLDVAMYSLNNTAIVAAIEDAKARGVKVRILLDHVQAFGNREITLKIKEDGLPVRIHSVHKIQHNKFAVADGHEVMTGSFNWTNAAENVNDENCLVIDDPAIAQEYEDHFEKVLWKENSEKKSKELFEKLKSRE